MGGQSLKEDKRKSVLIVRLGAFGDMIQASCVFPYWHTLGYEISLSCGQRAYEMVKYDPYVKYIVPHVRDSVPLNKLMAHWQHIGADYDRLCVLTGTVVEGQLLFPSNHYMWFAGDRLRRKVASKYNYYEQMVKTAGFTPILPVRSKLYFSKFEREWAKRLVKRELRNKYVMLWAHSGSSIHKAYAWYWHVIMPLLNEWQDLFVITTGDNFCIELDMALEHPRILTTSGIWSIRQAMAVVPYVDIVVGPETGLLNAAGCYDTPKICLLSHSSKDNLTKYWENDYSIQAPCECSPCHRLFKYKDDPEICPKGKLGHQICMEVLPPETLINQIRKVRKLHGTEKRARKAKKRARVLSSRTVGIRDDGENQVYQSG